MKNLILSVLSSSLTLTCCLTAMPSQASSTLAEDRDPTLCYWSQGNDSTMFCNSFKLSRFRFSEGSQIAGLKAEFEFNRLDFTFLLRENPTKQVKDSEGDIVNFYPITTSILEQPNGESKALPGNGAGCTISTDYSKVFCDLSVFSISYFRDAASSHQSGNSSQNTSVFQTKSYVDTEIALKPGDRVTVNASGIINFGLFTGSGGPEGIRSGTTYNYFTNLRHGQLVGRIYRPGMDEYDGWFEVGKGGDFTAQSSGTLEFIVNDSKPQDNAGGFNIEVSINP